MVLFPSLSTGSLLRSGEQVGFPSPSDIEFPGVASGLYISSDDFENDIFEPSPAHTPIKINPGDTQSRTLRNVPHPHEHSLNCPQNSDPAILKRT